MTEQFDAWWLPRIEGPGERDTLLVGELECAYPVPAPDLVERTVCSLRSAAPALAERPVADIVSAVDVVARRFLDPDDPLRRDAERLLTAATGYSPEMTRLVLNRMAADWRAEPLRSLLQVELADPAVLDGYTRVAGGWWKRAYGPSLAFNVFAGNVPGVAVTALIRSLLVKAPTLGKLASGQPVLPVLFARALHEVDPALGSAVALSYWPGGSRDAESTAIEAADTIVVYGGADAGELLGEQEASLVGDCHGHGLELGAHGGKEFRDLLEGADGVDVNEPVEARWAEPRLMVQDDGPGGCVGA